MSHPSLTVPREVSYQFPSSSWAYSERTMRPPE